MAVGPLELLLILVLFLVPVVMLVLLIRALAKMPAASRVKNLEDRVQRLEDQLGRK